MTGMSSISRQHASYNLLLVVLVQCVSGAWARECFQVNGDIVCNGLTVGARVGIAIGVFLLAMLLLIGLGAMRRQRIRRANLAYVTNQYPGGYQGGPTAHQGYSNAPEGGPPPNYPPYPAQAHVDQSHYPGGYGHGQQYGQSPPPMGYDVEQQGGYVTYAPPPGPPPGTTKQ